MQVWIKAERRVAARPIVAGVVLALGAAVAGLLLGRDDPEAPLVMFAFAVVGLLLGVGRAILWLALAGWTTVEVHDHQVIIETAVRRTVLPRDEVESLEIEDGDDWPELSRWALLPRVVVTTRCRQRRTARILMRPAVIAGWNDALADLIPGAEYRPPIPYW